jgi:hypothetical protein
MDLWQEPWIREKAAMVLRFSWADDLNKGVVLNAGVENRGLFVHYSEYRTGAQLEIEMRMETAKNWFQKVVCKRGVLWLIDCTNGEKDDTRRAELLQKGRRAFFFASKTLI